MESNFVEPVLMLGQPGPAGIVLPLLCLLAAAGLAALLIRAVLLAAIPPDQASQAYSRSTLAMRKR